jgi:hypothetical protein
MHQGQAERPFNFVAGAGFVDAADLANQARVGIGQRGSLNGLDRERNVEVGSRSAQAKTMRIVTSSS